MWKRLVRAVRSFLGAAVSNIENPELILEQNIRDLNDQVPRMNEQVAMVRANMSLLQKERDKHAAQIRELTAKIKAAIQLGKDEVAAQYAQRLQTEKAALAQVEAQLVLATEAYEKALTVKKAFMREKERKTQEAMSAIRDAQRAQWQAKVADALESFKVTGVDATHDEMVRKVNEQAALNEARMAMALESIDTPSVNLEEEVEKMQAMDLVKQMKLEMGLMEASPPEEVSPAPEKTLGKKVNLKS
ncbi:MAG: PspA/IM30 family protein [Cystobacterineae bacterium]|nr:PspA/IM30 family protein [Cystobacterineae bacterium]